MLVLVVPTGIFACVIMALLAAFIFIGEVSGDGFRVRQQDWLNATYHSPYIELISYKEAMLRYHAPEVAVIGTSRAGSFGKAFFDKPFVNLQSTVDSPRDLGEFVERNLTSGRRVEHLLIAAEVWWFADDPSEGLKRKPGRSTEQKFLANVNHLLLHRKGIERLMAIWSAINDQPFGTFMGIHGLIRREGFSQYGSYHYEQIVTGRRRSPDYKFNFSLTKLAAGEHRFKTGTALNMLRFEQFMQALRRLEQLGVAFTVILPPYAPSVASRMSSERFRHIPQLVAALRKEGVAVFDFTRPSELGDDDCEYIDGFHGGDVVYARMLAIVARARPQLRAYVDLRLLDEISDRHRGSAAWSRRTTEPEIDFLELGCQRPQKFAAVLE